jgi:osmotically-inducible protein OsmY
VTNQSEEDNVMKTDVKLRQDVIDELKWAPNVKAGAIGVAVKDGVVALSGYVDSYAEKIAAESAAGRVLGVKEIVQEIKVKLPDSLQRSDDDIARAATNALEWNVSVPHESIKVKVQDSWITLSGEVEWAYQRDAAWDAVRFLTGVSGVSNLITVKPSLKPIDAKTKIEKAIRRNARFDGQQITVETRGDKVVLEGVVHSYVILSEAENAACAAPGICEVENHLTVSP